MSTIVLAVIFLIRLILPFSILMAFGEWVRRRQSTYWFQK
jgi:hypothetical protein